MNVFEGEWIPQLAHIGWGIALTEELAKHMPLPEACGIVLVFAFVKEALEALGWAFWEPKQEWGSSLEDWSFWGLGILIGAVLFKFL